MTLRVGVVGARRLRNGTGTWVARGLMRAGCEVVGVSGTSEATAARAAEELAARDGLVTRGFGSLDAMLAEAAPDAVAICSPTPAHDDALERVLEAGAHCLCEKPLLWPADTTRVPDASLEERARALAEGFAARGRLLALNTQWPWTLPCFGRVHPDVDPAAATRFEMWMSPAEAGLGMIPDSMPHVLSMLVALRGPGEVEAPRTRWTRPARDALELGFVYRPAGAPVDVAVRLEVCATQPRPAGYVIDGRRVDREVELPDYRMVFVHGDLREPMPDPLDARLEAFVADVRGGRPTEVETLVQATRHLRTLAKAAAAGDDGPR